MESRDWDIALEFGETLTLETWGEGFRLVADSPDGHGGVSLSRAQLGDLYLKIVSAMDHHDRAHGHKDGFEPKAEHAPFRGAS